MSDNPEGWREVAVLYDATLPAHEEGERLEDDIEDDDIRYTDVHGGKTLLERRVGEGDRWVEVARFTTPDAAETAYNLEPELQTDRYRCVTTEDGSFIEKHVTDD